MKNFIIAFFLLFIYQGVSAQINANISGLEIGHTGLYDGVTLLKSIDKETFYYESNDKIEVAAHNIPYAGINWSTIIASFKNGTLIRIQLMAEDYPSNQSCGMFEKLNEAFKAKYGNYLRYSSTDAYSYDDSNIGILLSYDKKENSFTLTYTYVYKPQIGDGI